MKLYSQNIFILIRLAEINRMALFLLTKFGFDFYSYKKNYFKGKQKVKLILGH
jgi:hypothetical protein